MRLTICLAALAATVATASPAFAQQASAQAEARGLVLQPLTLSRVDDLDFGTVAGSAVAGTVTVNSDTGIRSVGGGVTAVPSTYQRARFDGYGQPSQVVQLTLNPPVGGLLMSGTNSITVNSMTLDNANNTTRTIGAGGNFTVYVGGSFGIAANQPNGLYAANFDLTADYQ